MKRWLIVSLCLAWSMAATAASANKQIQSSMLVTGSIVVAPDGTTQSYTLDQRDKLPSFVTDLIDKGTHAWRFEPILLNGKPVAAKASMSLRIVAERIDKEHISVHIAGSHFGQQEYVSGETISAKDRVQPLYPDYAVKSRLSGTVYLLLRVGRNGQVEDAVAQQVNLRALGSTSEMNHWRRTLADAALKAARQWTFNPPTNGKHVGDKYWVARLPVDFSLTINGVDTRPKYGHWDSYVPGPVEPVMWPDPDGLIQAVPMHNPTMAIISWTAACT